MKMEHHRRERVDW